MWILQNNIQINLENFWLDRLWHFKLSTVAVTQTGHFSLSHTALLVLLEHQSYGLFPLSMKKKINGGFLSNFPWQYFVSCGVFVSWVVTNKAYLIETSIHYLKVHTLAAWMRQKQSQPSAWIIHLLTFIPPPKEGQLGNSSTDRPPITDKLTASIYKYFFVNTISCS